MKPTFLKTGAALGWLTIATLQAHAQQAGSPLEETTLQRGFAPYLPPATAVTANKGTAIRQRVVATTMYAVNPNGSTYAVDSTGYKYSGKRGSSFDLHFMGYREQYPGTYTGTSRDFSEVAIQADSMTFYRVGDTVLFAARTYTTTGKLATNYAKPGAEPPFADGMLSINKYNSAGFVTSQRQLSWNTTTTAWDTARIRRLTYTVSGLITGDTTFEYAGTVLQPIRSVRYVHDAQGNLLQQTGAERYGAGWRDEYRRSNTYDAQNRMVRSAYEYNQGSGLVFTDLDSLEYTGALTAFTQWTRYTRMAGTWTKNQKWEKHLNTQMLADTLRVMSWNPSTNVWDIGTTTRFQYNSYNNPVRSEVYQQNATTPGLINTYYYELFEDAPSAVPGINKTTFTIYPNPAQDQLTIKVPGAPDQLVSVVITDISGRVMLAEQSQWKQDARQIRTGHLATGTYLIRIQLQGVSYQQAFVKK